MGSTPTRSTQPARLISQVFLFRKSVRLTTGCRLCGSLHSAPPLPYGVTDSNRMRYSIAITTHSLLLSANISNKHMSTGRCYFGIGLSIEKGDAVCLNPCFEYNTNYKRESVIIQLITFISM